MIELGQHWEFIAAAYGGTTLIVAILVGWTVAAAWKAKGRVARLETMRQGARGG